MLLLGKGALQFRAKVTLPTGSPVRLYLGARARDPVEQGTIRDV